jgi:hypothetical protein
VPASPKVSCVGRRGRRAGQLARWTGGLHDRGETTFPRPVSRARRPLHGGLRTRLGRGARWKPVGQPRDLRAGVTVDVEPARKHKAVERRHGSSGRESSEGRIPGTCAVGQPAAKLRGVATTELWDRGNPGLQESARLKPPRGNGGPVESAARRARSSGRSPRAAPGEGAATLVSRDRSSWSRQKRGTLSRRRRDEEPQERRTRASAQAGESRRRKPLGQCTPVVL